MYLYVVGNIFAKDATEGAVSGIVSSVTRAEPTRADSDPWPLRVTPKDGRQ